MERNDAVVHAWRRFCAGVTNGSTEQFDDLVSMEAVSVVGTAPGEVITDRSGMRFGFETEGVTLESRSPVGTVEGSLGWVFDEPRFGMPDGTGFDCRVTAILRLEEGTWRIVHAHFSVGIPDDEVVALQERWTLGAPLSE